MQLTPQSATPAISVLLITPDKYANIRKSIHSLRAQEGKEQLEIIILAPPKANLALDESELEGFFGFQVVEVADIQALSHVRVEGIRAAKAPVVAFMEDHVFATPGWATALIQAHQHDWAVVGPVVGNANPRTVISWTNLLIEYGSWLAPGKGGIIDHLPGHNSAYKRDVLLAYGSQLPQMLDSESILHWDLRAKGHRLYLEPKAKMLHLNCSMPSSFITLRFNSGRLFASSRARSWSLARRLLFTVASPLIPWVRLRRVLVQLREAHLPRRFMPSLLLSLTIGLIIDGIGEMVGYATGAGDSMQKLTPIELYRLRYISRRDRRALNTI